MSNKSGYIEKEGFKKSGKDYWHRLWKAPNTHIWFFFGTWLVKLPHFYLTLVMAFVAWSGWPWLFFMTYWNNTSSSYLPVCVSVHTANPFPVMETGSHSNSKILSLSEQILFSLQGKPVIKTGYIWQNWTNVRCFVFHYVWHPC